MSSLKQSIKSKVVSTIGAVRGVAQPTTAPTPGRLSPEDLARINSLELRARGVVEGVLQGLHRSPFIGYSVEFSSHRRYSAGDDLRHVNWKLFARNRKLYVKEFDAETNMNMTLLVDCSRSMQCRIAGSLTKYDYAATLAAALACLAAMQRDAIALGMIGDGITHYLEPSSKPGRWEDCVKQLSQPPQVARLSETRRPPPLRGGPAPADRPTSNPISLLRGLEQAAALSRQRGLVILLSDLIDEPEQIAKGLQQLKHRGHEVVVFHLLDPWERQLPADGRVRFADLESDLEVTTDLESVRRDYNQRIERWCQELQDLCLVQSIDRIEVLTDTAPTSVLIDYLISR